MSGEGSSLADSGTQFFRTADGTRLAYWVRGAGVPGAIAVMSFGRTITLTGSVSPTGFRGFWLAAAVARKDDGLAAGMGVIRAEPGERGFIDFVDGIEPVFISNDDGPELRRGVDSSAREL